MKHSTAPPASRKLLVNRRTLIGAGLAMATPLRAQTWPSRPVSIVVPFAAGGPTDLVARVLAEKLAPMFGQPVVVENRAGAGGDIGGQFVARAAPDGHVMLLSTTGSLTINRHLKPVTDYDPMRDLAPASLTFKSDHALVVTNALPATTLSEFVALAKARPDALAYGSAGTGATSHMIAELFKARVGVSMRHIPYRGAGPALNDLIAGHIGVMLDSLANSLSHIQAGNVRCLAVTGKQRHPSLPSVPTVAESGFPDFSAFAWGALLAPKGAPPAILERFSAAVAQAYADPATRTRLSQAGADPVSSSPAETAAFMAAENEQWGRIVRENGIRAE